MIFGNIPKKVKKLLLLVIAIICLLDKNRVASSPSVIYSITDDYLDVVHQITSSDVAQLMRAGQVSSINITVIT